MNKYLHLPKIITTFNQSMSDIKHLDTEDKRTERRKLEVWIKSYEEVLGLIRDL